jgi:regulator of protease activity HflC (stomatin/prohibitin superfamily)
MLTILLLVLAVVLTLVGPQIIRARDPKYEETVRLIRNGVRVIGVLLVLLIVASTSFVFIGQDETGHRHKIYFGGNLKDGAIIAADGEKGPQAEIMPPGFQFEPLLNVLNEVTVRRVVEVPEGQLGYLVASDGRPLRPDQTYAEAFAPDEAARMASDAAYFLTLGDGQKGPQTSVLTPGKYRLNLFLWDIQFFEATDIAKGFVGVIRSNVHSRVDFANLKTDKPEDCSPILGQGDGELAVPLVPVGCIGVWSEALNPGKYYINPKAYAVALVDTRIQTWEYKGGYLRRVIDLKVNQKGDLTQTERSEMIERPESAVGDALLVKVEGWDVPQELRVLVQITPRNAPFVVASVGDLEKVEKRILTPAIRSILRNVVGGTIHVPTAVVDDDGRPVLDASGRPVFETVSRPTRVLDLIENRDVLEQNVEEMIRPEGFKAGVDIKEVRFGDPVIPPEILVARQREQLAQQMRKAFAQERSAQSERITTEQAKATADQQELLVAAQIELMRSEQLAMARRNEGRGERDKLILIAEGQKAQAQILGEQRVVELRKFEVVVARLFDFLEKNPDVLTTALANAHKFVPERVFTLGGGGGANSLAGAAAILGDLLGGGRPPPATEAAPARAQ